MTERVTEEQMGSVELGTLTPGEIFELAPGRAPQAHTQRERLCYELVAHAAKTSVVVRVVVGDQLELLAGGAALVSGPPKHTERWTSKTLVVPQMRFARGEGS